MTQITAAFSRDANGVPIRNTFDTFITSVTRAYTGAASLGATGTTSLFTVTGIVMARAIGICSEDLASAGGGTISIGTTSGLGAAANAAALVATTTATNIDNGEAWIDATPVNGALLPATPRVCTTGAISEVIATGDITDGTLTIYCLWAPFTSDGNVVAAV